VCAPPCQLINQIWTMLTEQEGEFDADTRWAIAWSNSRTGEGRYGTAETLSSAQEHRFAACRGRHLHSRAG